METLFCYFLIILATQQSGAMLEIELRRTQVLKIGQAVICWSIIVDCPWSRQAAIRRGRCQAKTAEKLN
jgi:hypothetical protein